MRWSLTLRNNFIFLTWAGVLGQFCSAFFRSLCSTWHPSYPCDGGLRSCLLLMSKGLTNHIGSVRHCLGIDAELFAVCCNTKDIVCHVFFQWGTKYLVLLGGSWKIFFLELFLAIVTCRFLCCVYELLFGLPFLVRCNFFLNRSRFQKRECKSW